MKFLVSVEELGQDEDIIVWEQWVEREEEIKQSLCPAHCLKTVMLICDLASEAMLTGDLPNVDLATTLTFEGRVYGLSVYLYRGDANSERTTARYWFNEHLDL